MFDREALKETTFSWESAHALAMASQLAYQPKPAILKHVATVTWGFDDCQIFAQGETQGFIAWDSDVVVICFRGTESVGDWLANLKILREIRPYGLVHRGFLQGYQIVEDQIKTILDSADPAGKTVWATGHSLGAALATVAGAELIDTVKVSGFYTYGQPKTGNVQVRNFIGEQFAGQFHRLVNDDDVVPKVPPGYAHVGGLIQFDGRGNVKQRPDDGSGVESVEVEGAEPGAAEPDLTEAEFEALQAELRGLKESIESAASADPTIEGLDPDTVDASIEGFFPSIADHLMKNYIQRISRQIERAVGVDELLEQAVTANIEARSGLESTTGARSVLRFTEDVPVLLRLRDPKWQPPADLVIQSKLGNIVSARASLEQIELLKSDRGILSIDASREGGTPDCDVSLPFIHALDVQRPPIDERGDSAIVAVIDAGVDVLHEAFQDGAGKTRLLAVWDQRSSGNSPKAVDPAAYLQNFGALYLASDIQEMIDGDRPTPLGLRDRIAHGTHVTSIAAGRATGAFAGGVAPEAKIVVVIPDLETEPGDPASIGYSTSHVDALSFIRTIAENENLPVAVNVSLGMNAGAHDGTSTLEAAFDAFSGNGRDPGFVIIKSAGNERGHNGHAQVIVSEGGVSEISWQAESDNRANDYIEAWFSSFDDMEFVLIAPDGSRTGTVSAQNPKVATDLGGNFCQLSLTQFHDDNGDNSLVITISSDMTLIQDGKWTLEAVGKSIKGGGIVDAWVERDRHRAVAFQTGDNDAMTLSIPGTAKTVITVGACNAEIPIRTTSSSSLGPTRDKRNKPDLCAPGQDITAAHANQSDHSAVIPNTGTSMAAPHVTGTVALLLSRLGKDPAKIQVNANQVQRALVRSSLNFTGLHSPDKGYGILDCKAFIDQF